MKEQTDIVVTRPLSNDLYHYISKVIFRFLIFAPLLTLIEVLEVCIDKNISLFCIISSNVTLLVTELLGQFQNFLNTTRNH